MLQNALVKGTFVLTVTGLITRFIGFFFRIFLSHTFGAEQVGLYQLIFPIYALCFSLSSAGIETALSRCVARKTAQGKHKEADLLLYQSLFISLTLSLLLGLLIRKYATFLAIYILGDLRCEELIELLAFALPFATIHSCICGYYLGRKQTKIPAISQLIEQLARVASIYILYQISITGSLPISIRMAVAGLSIGETLSALFCARCFCAAPHTKFVLPILWKNRRLTKELLGLAIPLTSNRILMNVLQSIESISMPLSLQKWGYSNSEALTIYGVLTGMALPCILFPTALTSSVSTMLLPTVAEIQAESNLFRLKSLIRKVIYFGFGLGSLCGIIFLLLGPFAGNLLFDNTLAGSFIQTLSWICPFMYMNTTLISVINGLGKAKQALCINLAGLLTRITGVWFGIPHFGMNGYLIGLLISQILVSVLCMLQVSLYLKKRELF